MTIRNILSIDVEDYFCVHNFSHCVRREEWDSIPLRLEAPVNSLLDLFRRKGIEATFFVLGWVAERVPRLIASIEDAGHEIATHGYSHKLLTEMTPQEFEADLKRSLEILRGCVKQEIRGFRAPSFTITGKTMWAVPILEKYGIAYDSSVFPIRYHPDYGMARSPLTAHKIGEQLTEIPLSCVEILGVRVPCSGGGYFRVLPYAVTKALFNTCNRSGRPVVFYLHPWEVDPGQPRYPLTFINRFRHYRNLDKTLARMERLLDDFTFTSFRKAMA